MNFLTPIALVLISGGIFFSIIDPYYQDIKNLKKEIAQYEEIFEKTDQIRKIRENLQAKSNEIPEEKLERLKKMLPDHVDNIKLILNMNNIAQKNGGMTIRGITVDNVDLANQNQDPTAIVSENEALIGVVNFSFSVSTTYPGFKRFLEDVATSLRIIDITSLSMTPVFQNTEFGAGDDFYNFDVGIKTYWLNS